jgi:membrane-associated protein
VSEWLAHLTDLASLSAGAVYLVVFSLVFIECGVPIGFLLPGDSVLFTAGLLAAAPESGLSVQVLAAGVFVAAVAGNATGYWTGGRYGRPWLIRRSGRAAARLARAERFYQRYGWSAVVVARFIPWVRTFTPILAGIAEMPRQRFASANLVGAAVWGAGLVLLGYFAHSQPQVRLLAYVIAGTAIVLSIAIPTVGALRRRFDLRRRSAEPPAA